MRRALIVLAALVALWLSRSLWAGPLVRAAAPSIALGFGVKVEIEAASGNGTDHLVLRGVRALSLGERGSLRHLEAEELELELDLFDLVRGRASGVRRVVGKGVDVELDFGREAVDEAPSSRQPSPSGEELADLPLPSIELEDCRALLRFGDGSELDARGLDWISTRGGGSVVLDAKDLAYRSEVVTPRAGPLEARLALDARGVEIRKLLWGETLETRDTRFRWSDPETHGLSWSGDLGLLGGRAKLAGSLSAPAPGSTSVLDVELDLSDLDLAGAAALVPACPELGGRVDRVAGKLSFRLGESVEVEGSLDTRVTDLRYAGSEALDLEGALVFEDGFVRSQHFELSSKANRLSLTSVELPIERGSLRDQLRRGRAQLELDVRDLPRLTGRAEDAAMIREHHLELWATLEEGTARIERGQLETAGGTLTVRGGTIREQTGRGPAIALDLFADFADLAPVGELFGERPWGGNLSGTVLVQGNWPAVSAVANLSGEQVRIAGAELGEVEVRLEADRNHVVVPRLESVSPGNELSLSGALTLGNGPPSLQDLRFDLDVKELDRLLPWMDVSGELNLRGRAAGALGELEGEWSLYGDSLRAEGREIERVEGSGEFLGERVRIVELALYAVDGSAKLAGELALDPDWRVRTLDLTELALARRGEDLTLLRPTSLSFEGAWPRFLGFELAGSAGSLNLYLRPEEPSPNAPAGDSTAGSSPEIVFGVQANDFSPMSLIEPFVSSGYAVDGLRGSFDGKLSGGRLSFTSIMEVDRLELPLGELAGTEVDHPWALAWDASLEDDVLSVRSFTAESGETTRIRLRGRAPFQPFAEDMLGEGGLRLQGELAVPRLDALRVLVPENKPWPSGGLALKLDLGGDWSRLTGSVEVEASELDLDARGGPLFRGAQLGGRVLLGDETQLEDVRILVPDALSLHASGELGRPIDVRALVRGEAPFPGDTAIRLESGAIVEDSTWIDRLNRALGGGLFRRFGGRLAATLDLSGTLDEPRPVGQLELDGGSFKFSSELPAIDSLGGVFLVDGRRFEVVQLSGELGGEPFSVTGHVDLEEEAPELALKLEGRNLLFYRSSGVKVRADASLSVTGTPEEPHLGGEIRLTDSRFVKRYDFLALGRGGGSLQRDRTLHLFSFREEPLASTTFNVRVSSSMPFRVESNVVTARLRPDLVLSGTGELPEVLGKLYVDGGKVSLPANNLFLRPGTISFDRSAAMIPQLELLLENRIRGYEVSVTLNGPYDEPNVVFSSSPPLGPEDLAALVWAGQDPGEGLTSRTGLAGAQAVGAYIVQDLLTRMFSDQSTESDESFFDRFELFLGRDTTQDGGETIEMTYRIANEVLDEADTLYLATERDVYAHVNFGLRFVFRFD